MFDTYPYENLTSGSLVNTVSAAEKILAEGWKRRDYPLVYLPHPIPWRLKSSALRSWNFYIHCWDMLDPLLKAYSYSGDLKFLEVSIEVVEDWVRRYSQPSLFNEDESFAWYDMAVGMRAYRLAYILQAGRQAGLLHCGNDECLWNALLAHQYYLSDDGNIKFHNNHGYFQVAGQLAMGRRFATESKEMAASLAQGRQRLIFMLDQQFTCEGVHREHSPDYHRMVYETLKALIDAGLVDDAVTIAFAEKIEKALAWFVLPNQYIANFGDSDYRLMRRTPDEAERKWRTPEMRYQVTSGAIGHSHNTYWKAFPESGYFVARSSDACKPERLEQSSYLAQSCAFHSRTHKHADDLSFIWSEYGSNILVDAGRYGYLGKTEQGSKLWLEGHWYSDPNRVYCESTRAHNTLEFDGLNYPRKGVKPYGSALNRWVELDDGVLVVESECKHFKSIRHARVLFFKPGQWLLIVDWFHDNLKASHQVKQWFHLAPDLDVMHTSNGLKIQLPEKAPPLRVASLLGDTTPSALITGQSEPVMQGWWSPKERDIIPNVAFCYEKQGSHTGVFATVFSFSKSLQANPEKSRINNSGRKGRLSWSDDSGLHQVDFERPQEGELAIIHKTNKT